MSNTRRAPEGAPLSQARYMSSPEYAELRGVSGVAVAARCAVLDDPNVRGLLWFLQSLSLEPGGFRKLARDLIAAFPERLGTPTMHELGIKPGRVFKPAQVAQIQVELGERTIEARRAAMAAIIGRAYQEEEPPSPESAETLLEHCRELASARNGLEGFLFDLCINPRLLICSSAKERNRTGLAERLEEQFPDVPSNEIRLANLPYFRDIVGALFECKRRHEEAARESFVLTQSGKLIWQTLDFALKARRMVLVNGLEGRGKTEAVKAWCNLHRGEARFVSLKGITGRTNVFREISKAIGTACSYTRIANDMQNRVEDVLHRSGLMLVFDEAHFMFDPRPRMCSRPALVDWVDTSLCNYNVPVALVTTPQFLDHALQAKQQTGWNYRQFRRRVKRCIQLPEWSTDSDLESVARCVLPGINRAGIKLAVGYAKLSKRDLSALGDVALEAKLLAEADGRTEITFADVERAINEQLIPSDKVFAVTLDRPARNSRQRRGTLAAQPLQDPCRDESEGEQEADLSRSRGEDLASVRSSRVTVPTLTA